MKRFTMLAMLLVVASLVMAACAPAATPAAEKGICPFGFGGCQRRKPERGRGTRAEYPC